MFNTIKVYDVKLLLKRQSTRWKRYVFGAFVKVGVKNENRFKYEKEKNRKKTGKNIIKAKPTSG